MRMNYKINLPRNTGSSKYLGAVYNTEIADFPENG